MTPALAIARSNECTDLHTDLHHYDRHRDGYHNINCTGEYDLGQCGFHSAWAAACCRWEHIPEAQCSRHRSRSKDDQENHSERPHMHKRQRWEANLVACALPHSGLLRGQIHCRSDEDVDEDCQVNSRFDVACAHHYIYCKPGGVQWRQEWLKLTAAVHVDHLDHNYSSTARCIDHSDCLGDRHNHYHSYSNSKRSAEVQL